VIIVMSATAHAEVTSKLFC